MEWKSVRRCGRHAGWRAAAAAAALFVRIYNLNLININYKILDARAGRAFRRRASERALLSPPPPPAGPRARWRVKLLLVAVALGQKDTRTRITRALSVHEIFRAVFERFAT